MTYEHCPTCGRLINPPGKIKVTPEVESEVFRLRLHGLSQPAIGRELGISTATVNALLHGKYPRNHGLRDTQPPAPLIEQVRQRLQAKTKVTRPYGSSDTSES